MRDTEKKEYTLDELYNGMQVRESQLSNVYNIHIVLVNSFLTEDGDIEGTVGFIGSTLNSESDRLNRRGVMVTHIYNEEAEKEGEIYYDD